MAHPLEVYLADIAALRGELDISDGLADPRGFVLDHCCGTGAYLMRTTQQDLRPMVCANTLFQEN